MSPTSSMPPRWIGASAPSRGSRRCGQPSWGHSARLAAAGRIILAGRDIGTVVLPDAELKLYLDVSIEERARRRAAERDLPPDSTEAATILADLQRRDHIDSSREVAPLRIPDDAVIISSEGRQFEETVAEVVRIIRARERQARRDR